MLHLAQSSGGGTPSVRVGSRFFRVFLYSQLRRLGLGFIIDFVRVVLQSFLWARVFGHRALGKSLIGARGLRRRPTGQGRVRCGPHKAPITLQASMPYPPEIEASTVGLVMPKARRRSHRGLICRSHIPDISKNSQAFMGVSKHSPHCKDP